MKWVVALLALFFSTAALAADGTTGTPTATGTVASHFVTRNWSSTEWIDLCGYYSCGDNGGGRLHRETCTPDSAFCFADSVGTTFRRVDPAPGGVFDAREGGIHSDGSTTDQVTAINAMLTAVAANGVPDCQNVRQHDCRQ
jgi:hypothetical protein